MKEERKHLTDLIQLFQSATLRYEKLISHTPIQGVVVPGNANVKELAKQLQSNQFDIRPILYPTVPEGKERLRIVLHSFNTIDQVQTLINVLA